MFSFGSSELKKIFAQSEIHEQLIDTYRTEENEDFFEYAFDNIIKIMNISDQQTILDAGCGSGNHSIRLAKRGFSVLGIDFSKYILKKALINTINHNLQNQIKYQHEDITDLPYEDESFNYIICWGVLMHIPQVKKAIAELTRVLGWNGYIVIAEANMYSIQSILTQIIKFLKNQRTIKNEFGIEYWKITPTGKLLTRETNAKWYRKELEKHNCFILKQIPGQFTELYTKVSIPIIKKLIHLFNIVWLKYIKVSPLAYGKILIAKKVHDA